MMFVPLIIILLFWYFTKDSECHIASNNGETAIQILNKRLIDGEISEEEYEFKKKLINS
ncbi:SHOCT domain-containing protein [Clostridium ganghwense]|uniref:SHOCT domain-containing protein n=1 Tax=Clostridium ganghwense TaxID=312089 RepID=A0ABT4CMB0_9CLOT|nr:SHOCT domain-containing protein [Clostridium ganghwense]MCY6370193.1 SHOCT domain-containing protein [Clostridium ganghwense]